MATTKKTSSTKPELGQDIEPGYLAARAAVTNTGLSGMPGESDLALINKLSRSGNVDPATIYRFDCVPSTQQIDSYFTRMDVTSLINYADEAKSGVPVLNSHRSGGYGKTAELPIGRSFTGMVENDPDNAQMQRFVASAYMLRNNRANGSVNTDDIIAGIEAGTVSDISIGFAFSAGTAEKNYTDRTILRCSICGNDFLRSDPWDAGPDDCPHWPGEMYKTDGGKKSELCVLDVVNAHLSEFSTVYNGATPGAVILKAQRAASEGLLDRPMIHRLEDTYRTRLMDYATFQVPVIEPRKEKTEGLEINLDLNIEGAKQDLSNRQEAAQTIIQRKANDEMAVNKRELEDASKDGAKLALANLAKSIMGSRAFSDGELALFPEIETNLAAGELDRANALLLRLVGGRVTGEEGEGEGQFYGDTTRQENGDGLEEGEGDDQSAAATTMISFSLAANERQQFQALKDENIVLKRENKRLAPLAVTGERYRGALIEQTIRQAVRAEMGTETDTLDMLQHLPIEHIERIYSQYKQLGDNRLGQHEQDENGNLVLTGLGGRQTTPANPNEPNFGQALTVAAQRAGAVKRNDFKAYR